MTRKPARAGYDAQVALFPPKQLPRCAISLVKLTHALAPGAPRIAPEPLALEPSLIELGKEYAGSDDVPFKPATDVVVIGSAFAPDGGTARRLEVGLRVGQVEHRIVVWGRRHVEWDGSGRPRLGAPEPFQEVPLTYGNAYGGTDRRVALGPGQENLGELLKLLPVDHPGMYPRNPFGKGYLVAEGRVDGVELPNLEDSNDLLTAERLIVRDPRHWYRQPFPRCLAWTSPLMFPRIVYSGMEPWYPAPQDESMPEVRLGILPGGYRDLYEASKTLDRRRGQQEGSLGLVFDALAPSTPFSLENMSPEKPVSSFELPAPPQIELQLDGKLDASPPRLLHVVIEPGKQRFCLTYAAIMRDLPRKFIPGVHGIIPLSVRVDGDTPLPFELSRSVRQPGPAE